MTVAVVASTRAVLKVIVAEPAPGTVAAGSGAQVREPSGSTAMLRATWPVSGAVVTVTEPGVLASIVSIDGSTASAPRIETAAAGEDVVKTIAGSAHAVAPVTVRRLTPPHLASVVVGFWVCGTVSLLTVGTSGAVSRRVLPQKSEIFMQVLFGHVIRPSSSARRTAEVRSDTPSFSYARAR